MVPTQCDTCGRRFIANSYRKKHCDDCLASRNHNKRQELRFVGVDGEGVQRPDGRHEYILLSVGNRSLFHEDGRELTWYDIIPFLWECFQSDPGATYVGFYLGYDFTHWLKHLPEERVWRLLTEKGIATRKRTKSGGNRVPFPVEHRGWNFDMLGMKRFRLWREGWAERMYICDTGAFFQTSFLNAIDPKKWPDGAVVTDTEYKTIMAGKADRGADIVPYGTPVLPEMIEYNILENEVLARLMTQYNKGLEDVGLHLKKDQWFGPGQAAQAWLNKIGAPRRETFEKATDFQTRSHLRASYYGGWFEIFAHGHIPGTSWSYDINSAYPDIQSRLPCALHGRWTAGNSESAPPNKPYTLILGTVSGSHNYIGVGPHRLKTGNILRPNRTRGWYWQHELSAAHDAGILDDVEIEKWISYEPCKCPPPFADLRRLYEERLKVGKNTIAGKARRLVYNSTYGKTAQSIGVAKFANPFYASLITSLCRTYILGAIARHDRGANDVLMVATDGITFKHRNPNLHLSETTLGAWSETRNENLTLFMPGVYWDDYTRERLQDGGHPTLKSRGIPARALAKKIGEIDRQFADPFSGRGFPSFTIELPFSLTTPKLALARHKWHTCGEVSTTGVREINSDPSLKRNPTVEFVDGIARSFCYPEGMHGLTTTPYRKTFGDEELREALEIMTMDGPADLLLANALKRD